MQNTKTATGAGAAERALPRISVPGRPSARFIDGSYENSAGKRDYKLYIPGGYTGNTRQPVPLVVMLHGCAQSAEDLAAGSRMNAYAEEHTFLVAYPRQTLGANKLNCWNWYNSEDQHREQGEPSIIAGLTRQIMSEYAVAQEQVYVAGISAGGAMSVVLGATYPDLYAAIGVHSGVEYAAANNLLSAMKAARFGGPDPARKALLPSLQPGLPPRFVPLILFHGDKDHVSNSVNAQQITTQWALQWSRIHDGTSNGNAKGLQTRLIKAQVPGGRAYTRTIYFDPAGRDVMEKWIIHEAGHAWAGGDSRVMFMDPLGPNASAEITRFFLEHPMQ